MRAVIGLEEGDGLVKEARLCTRANLQWWKVPPVWHSCMDGGQWACVVADLRVCRTSLDWFDTPLFGAISCPFAWDLVTPGDQAGR